MGGDERQCQGDQDQAEHERRSWLPDVQRARQWACGQGDEQGQGRRGGKRGRALVVINDVGPVALVGRLEDCHADGVEAGVEQGEPQRAGPRQQEDQAAGDPERAAEQQVTVYLRRTDPVGRQQDQAEGDDGRHKRQQRDCAFGQAHAVRVGQVDGGVGRPHDPDEGHEIADDEVVARRAMAHEAAHHGAVLVASEWPVR